MEKEKENKRKQIERHLQIFQMNSGCESCEEDDNAYHRHPKPHYKPSIPIAKAAGNRQPKHEGERFPRQTEREDITNHCTSYGSAVKLDMIPQVIPFNPGPLHTVIDENKKMK